MIVATAISGCASCDEPLDSDGRADSADGAASACVAASGVGLDVDAFLAGGLESPITEVTCTLDDGTATTCFRVEVVGAPADHKVGPFCPRTVDATAADVGIWLEDGQVWNLDGAFIMGLATFYNDPAWQLYDPVTGTVNVTLSAEACAAAARPNVDPAYNNYCVECSLDYVDGGVSQVLLIPKVPVARTTAAELGGTTTVGVALNGVHFDPPAPVQAILAAHTIAAFDDCGGHVNLVAGYHYHAATGCSASVAQCDGHAPLIGYAMDGYAIFAMTGADNVEPSGLDTCRGHSDAERGYHYHAASAGENMFIGCFHGHTVGTTATGPGGPRGGVMACADQQPGLPCCGDAVCGGPETSTNCAQDCK